MSLTASEEFQLVCRDLNEWLNGIGVVTDIIADACQTLVSLAPQVEAEAASPEKAGAVKRVAAEAGRLVTAFKTIENPIVEGGGSTFGETRAALLKSLPDFLETYPPPKEGAAKKSNEIGARRFVVRPVREASSVVIDTTTIPETRIGVIEFHGPSQHVALDIKGEELGTFNSGPEAKDAITERYRGR